MARSIWSGAISFGLVNVPIKLYSAVSRKTVRFNQLNSETGNRIMQKRMDPETGEEVPFDRIVKGFELTKDRYVVITPTSSKRSTPSARARSRSRTSSTRSTSTRSTTTTRTTWCPTRAPRRRTGCC